MMARLPLLLVLLALQPACFIGRLYATDWPEPVEVHHVKTSDGWTLDLRHVKPWGPQLHPRPVIALHGIITNGRNMDVDERHSLARALARRGFDVWVPSLRNMGLSEKRSFHSTPDDQLNFDAFAARDLPAIIGYVRAKTGAAQVDFVGHSMGGMLLYAYLARGGADIARAVTLGAPSRFNWTGKMESLVRSSTWMASAADWAPIRALVLSTLPWTGAAEGPVERAILSLENTNLDTRKAFLSVGVDDVPTALIAQFVGWVKRDRFDSADQSIDYLTALRQVKTPVLVIAGKIDGLAPPWVVRPAYDMLGSPEKQWLVLGEANGQSADYNHMDMLLGEHAATDVFPLVASYLGR